MAQFFADSAKIDRVMRGIDDHEAREAAAVAEMEAAEKNAVSHRARAGEQLAAWLREGGLGG